MPNDYTVYIDGFPASEQDVPYNLRIYYNGVLCIEENDIDSLEAIVRTLSIESRLPGEILVDITNKCGGIEKRSYFDPCFELGESSTLKISNTATYGNYSPVFVDVRTTILNDERLVTFTVRSDEPISVDNSWTKLQSHLGIRKLYDTKYVEEKPCPVIQTVDVASDVVVGDCCVAIVKSCLKVEVNEPLECLSRLCFDTSPIAEVIAEDGIVVHRSARGEFTPNENLIIIDRTDTRDSAGIGFIENKSGIAAERIKVRKYAEGIQRPDSITWCADGVFVRSAAKPNIIHPLVALGEDSLIAADRTRSVLCEKRAEAFDSVSAFDNCSDGNIRQDDALNVFQRFCDGNINAEESISASEDFCENQNKTALGRESLSAVYESNVLLDIPVPVFIEYFVSTSDKSISESYECASYVRDSLTANDEFHDDRGIAEERMISANQMLFDIKESAKAKDLAALFSDQELISDAALKVKDILSAGEIPIPIAEPPLRLKEEVLFAHSPAITAEETPIALLIDGITAEDGFLDKDARVIDFAVFREESEGNVIEPVTGLAEDNVILDAPAIIEKKVPLSAGADDSLSISHSQHFRIPDKTVVKDFLAAGELSGGYYVPAVKVVENVAAFEDTGNGYIYADDLLIAAAAVRNGDVEAVLDDLLIAAAAVRNGDAEAVVDDSLITNEFVSTQRHPVHLLVAADSLTVLENKNLKLKIPVAGIANEEIGAKSADDSIKDSPLKAVAPDNITAVEGVDTQKRTLYTGLAADAIISSDAADTEKYRVPTGEVSDAINASDSSFAYKRYIKKAVLLDTCAAAENALSDKKVKKAVIIEDGLSYWDACIARTRRCSVNETERLGVSFDDCPQDYEYKTAYSVPQDITDVSFKAKIQQPLGAVKVTVPVNFDDLVKLPMPFNLPSQEFGQPVADCSGVPRRMSEFWPYWSPEPDNVSWEVKPLCPAKRKYPALFPPPEPVPGSISGRVYFHTDEGDRSINYVAVSLWKLIDGQYVFEKVTVTDAGGLYIFFGLTSGTYKVAEVQPAGYEDYAVHVGSLGGTVIDDAIEGIVVNSGQHGIGYDFGEKELIIVVPEPPTPEVNHVTVVNKMAGTMSHNLNMLICTPVQASGLSSEQRQAYSLIYITEGDATYPYQGSPIVNSDNFDGTHPHVAIANNLNGTLSNDIAILICSESQYEMMPLTERKQYTFAHVTSSIAYGGNVAEIEGHVRVENRVNNTVSSDIAVLICTKPYYEMMSQGQRNAYTFIDTAEYFAAYPVEEIE